MKALIGFLVIVVALVFSLNPYGDYLIKEGFKTNDSEKCMQGAALKRRLAKYPQAAATYKKIKETFSVKSVQADSSYYLAYCYEKMKKIDSAKKEYLYFVSQYPESDFVDMAKKRLSIIDANSAD